MQSNIKIEQRGFTLIELMITVAIVGILAAIAIPSYQESVRKSRRADAEGNLMGLANALERKYTENNNYCDQADASGANTCGDGTKNDTGPTALQADTTYYTYRITAATDSTYTLTATPRNAQASDKCGNLTLDHIGNKGVSEAASGYTADTCW
jgi:type IV pilus assembly protein PilE